MKEGIAGSPVNLAIFCVLYCLLLIFLYNIAKRAIWTYDMPPGSKSNDKKNYPKNFNDKSGVIGNEYTPNVDDEDGDYDDKAEPEEETFDFSA